MAAKTYGTIPANKQQTKIDGDTNGITKAVILFTSWDSYAASVPAIGTVDPDNSNFFLVKFSVERQNAEAKITLTYGTLTDSGGGLPATAYVETSSTMEKSIKTHPSFASWSADWDPETEAFKPGTSKYGIETYFVGTTQVTRTDYYSTQPSSDKADIGTRQSPGAGYGSSADWLLVASNRRKDGYFYAKENTYLYDVEGWNTDVYST